MAVAVTASAATMEIMENCILAVGMESTCCSVYRLRLKDVRIDFDGRLDEMLVE